MQQGRSVQVYQLVSEQHPSLFLQPNGDKMTLDISGKDIPGFLHLTRRIEEIAGQNGNAVEIGYIYVLRAEGMSRYKIGQTIGLEGRMGNYLTHSPIPCPLILTVAVPRDGLTAIERGVHSRLDEYRSHGEWFDLPDDVATRLPDLIEDVSAAPIGRLKYKAFRRSKDSEIARFRADKKAARDMEEITAVLRTPVKDFLTNIALDVYDEGRPATKLDFSNRLHPAVERRGLTNRILEMLEMKQLSFYEPQYFSHGDRIGKLRFVCFEGVCPATSDCTEVVAWDEREWGQQLTVLVHPPL